MKPKNKRLGFTMIELMIVISVIGILAVVLFPKITQVRDTASTTIVERNMRFVQTQAEYSLARAPAQTPQSVSSLLSDRLSELELENPVSGKKDLVQQVFSSGPFVNSGQGPAVHILYKDMVQVASGGSFGYTEGLQNNSLSGVVGVNIYIDSDDSRLTAEIFPYGVDGKYINNVGYLTSKR